MAGDIIDTGPHATMFKHSLGSKATERHYIFQVMYFARWLGLDDLEATLTFYNGDLNLLKQKIINYIVTYLEKDRKVAQNTRAARLNIIKQWYELAEVILPWKFIKTASLGK